MRTKSVVLLMLALGCGLIASIGITQVMAKRGTIAPSPTGDMASIFVAMTDISMGDPVSPQMVKLEDWPKDKIPPGALTKIEDVEGRRPKTKIYAGSPILDNHLLSKGASDQGATGLIPKGYRVVSVKTDAVNSGSGLLRPGDRVDVLVHLEKCPAKGIPDTSTRIFLQDIKVFAVNDVFALDSAQNSEESIKAQTVSLLVTPEQAEKVMLATELGRIRLAMRSPEDDEQTAPGGAAPNKLFGMADGADRDQESLLGPEPSAPRASDDADAFLKLLNSQKAQVEQPAAEVQLAAPSSAETWVVKILSGSDVDEAVLEARSGNSAQKSDSGPSQWKLTTGGAQHTKPEPCALPAPTKPATDAAEQPKEEPSEPSATPDAPTDEENEELES